MLITRSIRDVGNHEQEHVSDSKNDQGPTPDNHPSKSMDGRLNWHGYRLLHSLSLVNGTKTKAQHQG
jgi:hypothetical protein